MSESNLMSIKNNFILRGKSVMNSIDTWLISENTIEGQFFPDQTAASPDAVVGH